MTDLPTLDDLERDIVRALSAKAGQLDVDDAPFRPEARPQPRLTAVASPSPGRTRHRAARRMLAAAAVVLAIAGGLTAIPLLRADEPAAASIVWTAMPAEGTAAYVPAVVPDGWTLRDAGAGSRVAASPATWQLFAVDGPSPLARGVVIGSTVAEDQDLGGEATHTVQGHPARFRDTGNPLVPEDAIELWWAEPDVVHEVVAVGLTEAELLHFLDSLEPGADAAAGFTAPAGSALAALDTVTVESNYYAPFLSYADPAGSGTLQVMSQEPATGGGLIHRLVGTPEGDGLVIRGDGSSQSASLLQSDGWEVNVVFEAADGDPGLRDAILASLEPMTRDQFVGMAAAHPVTSTTTVGGWTVEVRGSDAADLALCLTPAPPAGGAPVCTTAQTGPGLTAGSVLVDGAWVVVALTDGSEPAAVETSYTGPDSSPDFVPETLTGERTEAGGRVVEVISVPTGVEDVAVMAPAGDDSQQYGFGYSVPG